MVLHKISDVLSILRISRSQFYNRVAPEMPPTLLIGNSPRYSEEALADWIQKKQSELKRNMQPLV